MFLYNIAKKWYLGQLVVFLVKYGSAKQQRNGLLSKWDWKLGDLAIVDLYCDPSPQNTTFLFMLFLQLCRSSPFPITTKACPRL